MGDHTSRVVAGKIKVTPKTSPKTTRKLTILTCFAKISITVVISLQVLYRFRHQNKLRQLTIFHLNVNTIVHFLSNIGETYTL